MTLTYPGGLPFAPSDDEVIAATRTWIERAVIGLNLCPFARSVYLGDQLRLVVSPARTPDELLGDLAVELTYLAQVEPVLVETTLLITPHVLKDFLDFNDFLDVADEALAVLKLTGTLQIASFHPGYRFEGRDADDPAHLTNRSPWPSLHLLREASIARAAAAFHNPAAIYAENMRTMAALGHSGWKALFEPPCAAHRTAESAAAPDTVSAVPTPQA
ncbi:MAG: DUF1415 domain-containing protein [Burkholderiaceae bacterium]